MIMHGRTNFVSGNRRYVANDKGKILLKEPHPVMLTYRKAKARIREFARRWDLEMIALSLCLSSAAFLKAFGYVA